MVVVGVGVEVGVGVGVTVRPSGPVQAALVAWATRFILAYDRAATTEDS